MPISALVVGTLNQNPRSLEAFSWICRDCRPRRALWMRHILASRSLFAETLNRACAFAAEVATKKSETLARQAASALYHITSAIGLAREAATCWTPHRRVLAQMVLTHLTHRLLPRDPLCGDVDAADFDDVLAN